MQELFYHAMMSMWSTSGTAKLAAKKAKPPHRLRGTAKNKKSTPLFLVYPLFLGGAKGGSFNDPCTFQTK